MKCSEVVLVWQRPLTVCIQVWFISYNLSLIIIYLSIFCGYLKIDVKLDWRGLCWRVWGNTCGKSKFDICLNSIHLKSPTYVYVENTCCGYLKLIHQLRKGNIKLGEGGTRVFVPQFIKLKFFQINFTFNTSETWR